MEGGSSASLVLGFIEGAAVQVQRSEATRLCENKVYRQRVREWISNHVSQTGSYTYPSPEVCNSLYCEGVEVQVDEPELQPEVSEDIEPENREDNADKKDLYWSHEAMMALISMRQDMDESFQRPKTQKDELWKRVSRKLAELNVLKTGHDCDRKWRNLTITFKRRKDSAKKSGGAANGHWAFHDRLDEMMAGNPSIDPNPSCIYSSCPRNTSSTFPSSSSTPISSHSSSISVSSVSSPASLSTSKFPPTPLIPSPSSPTPLNTAPTSPISSTTALPSPVTGTSLLLSRASPSQHLLTPRNGKSSGVKRKREEEPPLWFQSYMEQRERAEEEKWSDFQKSWTEFREGEAEKLSALQKLIKVVRDLCDK